MVTKHPLRSIPKPNLVFVNLKFLQSFIFLFTVGSLRQLRNHHSRPNNLPDAVSEKIDREDIPPTPTSLQRNTFVPQGLFQLEMSFLLFMGEIGVVRTNAAQASVATQQQARAAASQLQPPQSRIAMAQTTNIVQQQSRTTTQTNINAPPQPRPAAVIPVPQDTNNTAGRRSNVVKEVCCLLFSWI